MNSTKTTEDCQNDASRHNLSYRYPDQGNFMRVDTDTIDSQKPMNLSTLRRELFNVVDRIIATGESVEIEREGHKLRLVLDEKKDKFSKLKRHEGVLNCSIDELDNPERPDWEWSEDSR